VEQIKKTLVGLGMFRTTLLLSCAFALCGCSAVRIELEYLPEPTVLPLLAGKTFSLAVTDQRHYVTSGPKAPKYLGHTKGSLGVVYSYSTSDQAALVEHVRRDLSRDLQSLGMIEDVRAPSVRLNVRLYDWNFDAGIHGRFWYDAHVAVDADPGQPIANIVVKGEQAIEGQWGDPARLKVEDEIPGFYEQFIRKLVRENPEVIAALAQARPANQDGTAALLPRPGP
jgi:hypothetical protein